MMKHISIGDKKGIKLTYYRNNPYVNLREYFIAADGACIPTKKGILLNMSEWAALKNAVTEIDDTIEKLMPKVIPTIKLKSPKVNAQPVENTTHSTERPSKKRKRETTEGVDECGGKPMSEYKASDFKQPPKLNLVYSTTHRPTLFDDA